MYSVSKTGRVKSRPIVVANEPSSDLDDENEVLDPRREAAKAVVRDAGFPLWRPLVDRALTMLKARHRPEHAAKLLKLTAKRLPAGEGIHTAAAR